MYRQDAILLAAHRALIHRLSQFHVDDCDCLVRDPRGDLSLLLRRRRFNADARDGGSCSEQQTKSEGEKSHHFLL
jgi:hypothetical protein